MNNLNAKIHCFDESLISSSNEVATVIKIDQDVFTIEINDKLHRANKAYSCFIEPLKNDLVLVKELKNKFYIVSILKRENSSVKASIKLPDQTSISSRKLAFEAISISNIAIEYEIFASKALSVVDTMKTFVRNLYEQTSTKRVKSNQLLKEVTDFEQNIVEDLRLLIKKHCDVQAQAISFVSEEDTNIDARSVSIC